MSFAGDLRAVVRHRDFRRLFATRLTSQAADGMFQAALASLFFFSPERQTSAGSVAAAFATLLLPYSLVGPFAGVLLDRWRRRQVLVYANLVRAGMVLGVAALSAADVTGVPLYAAVLACLSVNRFFLATAQAVVPRLVPGQDLPLGTGCFLEFLKGHAMPALLPIANAEIDRDHAAAVAERVQSPRARVSRPAAATRAWYPALTTGAPAVRTPSPWRGGAC